MITHHPGAELLLDHAAGSLAEPLALFVAAHLALCPDCRARAAELEETGGALLGTIEPAVMSGDALDRMLARLGEPTPPPPPPAPRTDERTRRILPSVLWPYVGDGLGGCRWHWRGPGVREVLLPIATRGWRVSLFRVRPGASVPTHSHQGTEYTLVLAGGLTDRAAADHLERGDVDIADASRTHVQVADPDEECLCLAVLDAPVRFRWPLNWIARPFQRF